MKKILLSHMTWLEIEKIVKKKVVVLIPVGSVEAQNTHNPIGYDYLLAESLAMKAAQNCNAIVTPTINFGYSERFIGFPGVISLKPSTLQAIFEDVLYSLVKTGFDHFLFINGHEPNKTPLLYAASRIRDTFGIIFTTIWPTELARNFGKELFENAKEVFMHGNEPSTSILKYLFPELVRIEQIEKSPLPNDNEFKNFKLSSPTTLSHEGQKVPIFLRLKDISRTGGWGEPSGDSKKGEIIFNKMVDFLISFVKKYQEMNTHI